MRILLVSIGFGYISSIDDYRVGSLLTDKEGLCCVYIFSLRSGKWRKTDTLNYSFTMARRNVSVLVDDTIYWPPKVQKQNKGKENHIVGLNLFTGRLKKFPLMNLLTGYDTVNVFRMEDCLSLCCVKYVNGNYYNRVSDLWMLKQHDDWNSWEKTFCFDIGGVDLVCVLENGKCLVSREDQLKLLDHNEVANVASEELEGTYLDDIFYCIDDIWNYVESLISPFRSETVVSIDNEDN